MNDTAPDTSSSSTITNHAFVPDDQWWSTCERCGLAEAAHKSSMSLTTRADELAALTYRCPYCVDRGRDVCEHGREGALGLDMKPLGPVA